MVSNKLVYTCIAFCLLLISSAAQAREEIRFYEANKFLQTDRLSFVGKKAREPGCHNFLRRNRVYQINQIGFSSCSVYSQKDCEAESLMELNRTKDETPVTTMSQGFSWFLIDENERGAFIRSWHCELEAPSPEQ